MEVKSPKIQFISFTQVLFLKLLDDSFFTLIDTCYYLLIFIQPDTMLIKMSSWGPDTAGRLARYFEPIIKLFLILRWTLNNNLVLLSSYVQGSYCVHHQECTVT